MHPDEIHLLVAVVKYQTRIKAPRLGVCSTWLASLDPSQNPVVPVWLKRGTIKFPENFGSPVIMVGPGMQFYMFVEEA